jgi:hypothetical protein
MQFGGRRAVVILATLAPLVAPAWFVSACTSEAAEPPTRAEVPTTAATTSSSATTDPPPATATTTPARTFEPLLADPALPIRDQVEAAYLFHWEVLSYAGRTGDASILPTACR